MLVDENVINSDPKETLKSIENDAIDRIKSISKNPEDLSNNDKIVIDCKYGYALLVVWVLISIIDIVIRIKIVE